MVQNKILIVDDEKAIIDLMELFFSRKGYLVSSAESGEKALELLEKDKIQVMFLDLNMPDMNGIDLCRTIRKDNPMAMIFAITGYASLFELSACREAGFDDYFKKPIKTKILLATVESAFATINCDLPNSGRTFCRISHRTICPLFCCFAKLNRSTGEDFRMIVQVSQY